MKTFDVLWPAGSPNLQNDVFLPCSGRRGPGSVKLGSACSLGSVRLCGPGLPASSPLFGSVRLCGPGFLAVWLSLAVLVVITLCPSWAWFCSSGSWALTRRSCRWLGIWWLFVGSGSRPAPPGSSSSLLPPSAETWFSKEAFWRTLVVPCVQSVSVRAFSERAFFVRAFLERAFSVKSFS